MEYRRIRSWFLVFALGGMFFAGEAALARLHPLPQYQGIGLGSTLEETLKKLGPPLSREEVPPDEETGTGILLKLTYKGLELYLCKPKGHVDHRVHELELIGPDWVVLGVRPGISRAKLLEQLSKPEWERDEPNGERTLIWSFSEGVGWYYVRLREGKVVSFGAAEKDMWARKDS